MSSAAQDTEGSLNEVTQTSFSNNNSSECIDDSSSTDSSQCYVQSNSIARIVLPSKPSNENEKYGNNMENLSRRAMIELKLQNKKLAEEANLTFTPKLDNSYTQNRNIIIEDSMKSSDRLYYDAIRKKERMELLSKELQRDNNTKPSKVYQTEEIVNRLYYIPLQNSKNNSAEDEQSNNLSPSHTSLALSKNSDHSLGFLSRFLVDEEIKKQKLKLMQEEAIEREMKDCTFNPKIIHLNSFENEKSDFYERMNQFQNSVNNKIEYERKKKEKIEISKLTFSPMIIRLESVENNVTNKNVYERLCPSPNKSKQHQSSPSPTQKKSEKVTSIFIYNI